MTTYVLRTNDNGWYLFMEESDGFGRCMQIVPGKDIKFKNINNLVRMVDADHAPKSLSLNVHIMQANGEVPFIPAGSQGLLLTSHIVAIFQLVEGNPI